MTKFNRIQKFNKTNIKDIPKNKSIVYEFINNKGENIYTGVAGRGRVQQRLTEHLKFKEDHIAGGIKFKVAQVENKEVALKVEKQIIKKESPRFNKQYKK